jgi:hypothetical protein
MVGASVIILIGVIVLGVFWVWLQALKEKRRDEVLNDVEAAKANRCRKEKEIDQALSRKLLGDESVDNSIGEYQTDRGALGPTGEWEYDQADSDRQFEVEKRRRIEAVNRGLLLPAFAGGLLIALMTTAGALICLSLHPGRTSETVQTSGPRPPVGAPLPIPNPPTDAPVDSGKAQPPEVKFDPPVVPVLKSDSGGALKVTEVTPGPNEVVIQGTVVSQTGTPVVGAEVVVAQDRTQTGTDGSFRLALSFFPIGASRDCTVRVSHPSYVSHVERLTSTGSPVRFSLQPRWRVSILRFQGTLAGEPYNQHAQSVLSPAEKRLNRCPEIELVDAENRDEIVRHLARAKATSGMYDRDTLLDVGKLRKASHLFFGKVTQTADRTLLHGDLVSIETGRIVATSWVEVLDVKDISAASEHLADQLIAQLADVTILYPRQLAHLHQKSIRVTGTSKFRPDSWALFLMVQPTAVGRHYIQARVTEINGGIWLAPSVHLGEDLVKEGQDTFLIHAVLVDPELCKQLEKYDADIKAGRQPNAGIDLTQFGTRRCRILGHVEVSRAPPGAPIRSGEVPVP